MKCSPFDVFLSLTGLGSSIKPLQSPGLSLIFAVHARTQPE